MCAVANGPRTVGTSSFGIAINAGRIFGWRIGDRLFATCASAGETHQRAAVLYGAKSRVGMGNKFSPSVLINEASWSAMT